MDQEIIDQEYEVTGTLEDIANLLKNDFGLQKDLARELSAILIYGQNNKIEHGDDEIERDLAWFYEDGKKTTMPVLGSKYTVSFSGSLVEAAKLLMIPAVLNMTNQGELPLLQVVLSMLIAIATSTKKIKDNDWCVYSSIYKGIVKEKKYAICPEDIEKDIRENDMEGKFCFRADLQDQCPFRWEDGVCSISLSDIKQVFEHLEKQNVIKPGIIDGTFVFCI